MISPDEPSCSDDRRGGPEARAARRWLALGVGSLILAGLLSLLLVVARAPGLSQLVTDPKFFRRCLVVHVDLSLVVWLYAIVAGLLFLLPRPGQSSLSSRLGVFVATGGVGLLLLAAGAPGAEPVLANYVPMIDHWSFAGGLVLFAGGVLLAVLDRRLLPAEPSGAGFFRVPPAALVGLRATGVALILTVLTFAASWVTRPAGLVTDNLYELTNWGGGHVMQLASSLAMVSVWLLLLGDLLGVPPLSRRTASALFGLLLAPWLAAPLLAARGIQDVWAREAFTTLMRWAIFPVVAVFLLLCVRALVRARRAGELGRERLRDPRFVGFVASAGLTVLGWLLGALIRGSTTMIPAHYHAAIGGVTVAFMAACTPLLEALAVPIRATPARARLAAWQPALFGAGQAVFAVGFAFAGAHGMGRKVYGAEQQIDGVAHTVGLAVMGLGGLGAIVAGVVFLTLVVQAFWRRARSHSRTWVLGAPEPGGVAHG